MQVRITHILNVHDAGVIINPALATAQVHGGMGMGIGWALYEELLVDPATGRVHNNNLLDYKFPTTCDIPDLDCAFVETATSRSASRRSSVRPRRSATPSSTRPASPSTPSP